MSTIKIYGVSCEADVLSVYVGAECPPLSGCVLIGPADWRDKSYTSQEARARAKREGWKRVKHEGRYGAALYDVCPCCYPLLESALKAVQP